MIYAFSSFRVGLDLIGLRVRFEIGAVRMCQRVGVGLGRCGCSSGVKESTAFLLSPEVWWRDGMLWD